MVYGRIASSRRARLLSSPRFNRQVKRCLVTYVTREVDSATLGRVLYGRETAVRLILADLKDAVSAALRSLAG